MAFELPELPYSHDALEPNMTQEQWKFIMGNTTCYASKLNAAIEGSSLR